MKETEEKTVLAVGLKKEKVAELLCVGTEEFPPIRTLTAPDVAAAITFFREEPTDAVILNLPAADGVLREAVSFFCRETSAAVLLLLPSTVCDEELAAQCAASGAMLLTKPLTGKTRREAVPLFMGITRRLSALRKEKEAAEKRLSEMKTVNHAKWLLIRRLGIDEEEAHRMIEKQAMDMRRSRGDVAAAFIRMYEN